MYIYTTSCFRARYLLRQWKNCRENYCCITDILQTQLKFDDLTLAKFTGEFNLIHFVSKFGIVVFNFLHSGLDLSKIDGAQEPTLCIYQ